MPYHQNLSSVPRGPSSSKVKQTGHSISCLYFRFLARSDLKFIMHLSLSHLTKLVYIRFSNTVQFNYNFTHARDSTHDTTRVFACEMQIFAV